MLKLCLLIFLLNCWIISVEGSIYIPFDKYYVSIQNQVVVVKRTKINPGLINRLTGDFDTKEDFFIVGKDHKLIYIGEYDGVSAGLSKSGSHLLLVNDKTLIISDGCRIHVIGEKEELNYNNLDTKNCSEEKGEEYYGVFAGSATNLFILRYGRIGLEKRGYGGELLKVDRKGFILNKFKMDSNASLQIFFDGERILVSNKNKNNCLDENLNLIQRFNSNIEWNVGFLSDKFFFGMKQYSNRAFIWQKDKGSCFKEYSVLEDKESIKDDLLVQVNNFNDGRFFYFLIRSENLCYADYSRIPIEKNCFSIGDHVDYLRKEDENIYEAVKYRDLYFGYQSLKFRINKNNEVEILQDWESKNFK